MYCFLKKLLCVVLILFSINGFAQKAKPPTVSVIDTNIIGNYFTQDLTANWTFKYRDKPAYASAIISDSGWEQLADAALTIKQVKTRHLNKGIGWFRTQLQVDRSLLNKPIVFYLKGIGAASVYVDEKKMKLAGVFDSAGHHQYVNLDMFPLYLAFDKAGTHFIAVRYENKDFLKNKDPYWGFSAHLTSPVFFTFQRYSFPQPFLYTIFGIATLYLSLFLVHLLMYLFYKKEISNLYFALFNGALSISFFIFWAEKIQSQLPLDHLGIVKYLRLISLLATCFSLSAFVTHLFHHKKVIHIIISVLSIAILVMYIVVGSDTMAFGILIAVLCGTTAIYTISSIILAMIKKARGAKILGFGLLASTLFFLTIIIYSNTGGAFFIDLSSTNGKTLLVVTLLCILSLPLSISAFLAWRFADTNKHLNRQIIAVETLSNEKRQILEEQNEQLEQQVEERTRELQLEKQKSDDLLLNILPEEVAEELKAKGASNARQYDEASVLFTDFVHFTQTSEKLGVDKLLEELNINFTAFDNIMERHGLEKIKTIGDAYLAVCGLPAKNKNHAQNTVAAALEIVEFVRKRKQEVPYDLDIRIGINSGPLIAGIIGIKKFAYDIWGDTVNTAARMEQNSEAGKINISKNTYQLIKDQFICNARGEINAKGKGMMAMYFVAGRLGKRQ